MKTKLLFSWDITLLLVIASFVYVCFDKVIGLLALMAVSRDHPTMDMIPLLTNLTNLNGGYSEKLMGLVGTFFTIVLAGSLFKSQQNGQDAPPANPPPEPATRQRSVEYSPESKQESIPSSESKENNDSNRPVITKIPD